MKCLKCNRDNLTEKELKVHTEYFHKYDYVGEASKHIDTAMKAIEQSQPVAQGACPDCGSTLWFQEGCASCKVCGYSKCG